jgi:hypothetical protein
MTGFGAFALALSDHFPSRRMVRRCTVGAAIPVGRKRTDA